MNPQANQPDPLDWRELWAKMRGAHAALGTYSARCLASGGHAGEEEDGERVAINLHYAAGQRLRFQTDAAQAGTTDAARAGVVIWGHAGNYFAWRPGGGLEPLGSDVEVARNRCCLIAPRVGELLQLLTGRDLSSASPLAARPEEVKVSRLSQGALLTWRSVDGTTLWQARMRNHDSALLGLRSDVDGSFDMERALGHATGAGQAPAQAEALLLEERARANWSELRVEPRLDGGFDEDLFLFAPPL